MLHVARSTLPVLLVVTRSLGAQQTLPPLPDTSGFGVHVLALARAPDNALWVGTYGQGIFVLRPGAGSWEQTKHSSDTTGRTISFDFVHAFGFGPNGAIWYGTVGSGWACRPTAVRPGPTGSSRSSAPSGNTSRPTASSRGAIRYTSARPTGSSCRGIAARRGRKSPTRAGP